MSHPSNTHTQSFPPTRGVDRPEPASDAPLGTTTSFACDRDLRDALTDLTQENRLSILRLEDRKCAMGVCLEKHGLARWSTTHSPGRWVITNKGWLFLETRTLATGETR